MEGMRGHAEELDDLALGLVEEAVGVDGALLGAGDGPAGLDDDEGVIGETVIEDGLVLLVEFDIFHE